MKTKNKSKTVSKSKPKKNTASSKKTVHKKAKPVAKKAPSKKNVKAKPVAKETTSKKTVKAKPVAKKATAKAIHKVKPKAAGKSKITKKATLKSPAKATNKPVKKVNAPVVAKTKISSDKNNKPNSKHQPSSPRSEENKTETPAKNSTPPNRPSVGRPIPVNRRPEPARAIISNSKPEVETGKNRYADNELEEFRAIINKKLTNARRELATLQAQMTAANEHGTDDTASTFKILEDGSDSLAKEEAGQLASRQKKFIEQLENALVRIENKTYGICRVTGKLIPKERLRAVPHTTQSIEAKLNQYRD